MGNKLTVYSNGITRVQRVVSVNGKTTISIPVRKLYVSDVLATVGVFGSVKQVEPPSYTNDASKNILKLDPSNIHFALITKLSGAAVKILQAGQTYEGRLAGAHQQDTSHSNGSVTTSYHVIIIDKNGVTRQFAQGTYSTLEFTEPEVQRLIDTALSKNFESVRPDSVLVKLVLEPVSGLAAEARIEYAIPTAAWQSIYQLRVGSKGSTLEYNAKIDNPTDEDWLKSKVSVVVGEPITLETTLGEVKTPARSKVDLVGSKAAGPIRAQTLLGAAQVDRLRQGQAKGGGAMFRMASAQESHLECADAEELAGDVDFCAIGNSFGAAAEVGGATAEEVGDFAVFTSTDEIDVKAGMSGVVRLLNETVDAKEVLFFDKKQDADRAYRGVRFTNSTPNSLGQGICTVYLGDTLAGQSEFRACKPGQTKTIVFARENGVTAHASAATTNSRVAVGVKSGEIWSKTRSTTETTYTFTNLYKETAFEVEVGHDYNLTDKADLAVTKGVKLDRTKTGVKLTADLPAGGTLTFTLTETKVNSNAWNVVGAQGLTTMIRIIGDDEKLIARLQETASYKKAKKISDQLDDLNVKLNEYVAESAALKEEQRRLLSLVQAGSAASQLSKWQGELDTSEDRIKELDKKLVPNGRKDIKAKGVELEAAMREFVFDVDADAKTV